jgi:glycosyltransferase involved in cell wall biosynthesis
MSELISVVIPAYNAEKYIEKCLDSVFNQTYTNLEVIVVNDGSTDNTKKILDAYVKKESKLKIIHKVNTGVSDTRNKGLEIATGAYIGFVDSDDLIKPDFYYTLHSLIKNHNADIAHCGFELVGNDFSKVFYGTKKLYVHNKNEAIDELLTARLFEPSTCSKLYKRELIKEIKFDTEIKFNEDLLYNVKAFKKANTLVFLDLPLYLYVCNPKSASRSSQSLKTQDGVLEVSLKIMDILNDSNLHKTKNKFYVNKLITIYKLLLNENLQKSDLGLKVKKLLIKSTNKYLNFRMFFLKFTLLYFTKIYLISQLVYDTTFGKNKKWEIPNN